ncbi:MAG: type I methionyl aminopeptidase [Leptospiraceae bacterium]|nr:type I methionyl aminopeptidase [Leptospiraceae bacterium]
MSVSTPSQISSLQKVGQIVASTIRTMRSRARAGMTTAELDAIGYEHFSSQGARSAPDLTYGFPGQTCISVNQEVAHGIPGEKKIQDGDLINVDVSLELDGFFADSGASFCLGNASEEKERLCRVSKHILETTVASVRSGTLIRSIGRRIHSMAREAGYEVILNLAGHGTGGALHEEPYDILNYEDPRDNRVLKAGQVIAIETFISTGARFALETDDGWTLTTHDGSYVAQFEHTLIVRNQEPLILTL